jgi:hypothetical protein
MLLMTLKINDLLIGRMKITRLDKYPTFPPPDDSVNRYEVTLDGEKIGVIQHRYGDGAWLLLRQAAGLVPLPPTAAQTMGT